MIWKRDNEAMAVTQRWSLNNEDILTNTVQNVRLVNYTFYSTINYHSVVLRRNFSASNSQEMDIKLGETPFMWAVGPDLPMTSNFNEFIKLHSERGLVTFDKDVQPTPQPNESQRISLSHGAFLRGASYLLAV
jgi:hypothetical protein